MTKINIYENEIKKFDYFMAYYKIVKEDIINYDDYVKDLFNFDDDNIDENKIYSLNNNNNNDDSKTNEDIEDNNYLDSSKNANNLFNKKCYGNLTKKDNIES